MKSTKTATPVWIKPSIAQHELVLRTLLGENGWLTKNLSAKPVLAMTAN